MHAHEIQMLQKGSNVATSETTIFEHFSCSRASVFVVRISGVGITLHDCIIQWLVPQPVSVVPYRGCPHLSVHC